MAPQTSPFSVRSRNRPRSDYAWVTALRASGIKFKNRGCRRSLDEAASRGDPLACRVQFRRRLPHADQASFRADPDMMADHPLSTLTPTNRKAPRQEPKPLYWISAGFPTTPLRAPRS